MSRNMTFFSCWLEMLNFHSSSTLIITPIKVTGRKSNLLAFLGMGGLKKSKVGYIACMHIKYQFLPTKWLEMEAKALFWTILFKYFVCIFQQMSKIDKFEALWKTNSKVCLSDLILGIPAWRKISHTSWFPKIKTSLCTKHEVFDIFNKTYSM